MKFKQNTIARLAARLRELSNQQLRELRPQVEDMELLQVELEQKRRRNQKGY